MLLYSIYSNSNAFRLYKADAKRNLKEEASISVCINEVKNGILVKKVEGKNLAVLTSTPLHQYQHLENQFKIKYRKYGLLPESQA